MGRPVPQFRGFIGKKKRVDQLRRQLEGARVRGEPFPDTLFAGPSGVGKTLLAKMLSEEFGTSLMVINGNASPADLVSYVRQAKPMDFLFIDEGHNLPAKSQELLYQVIDQQPIPLLEKEQQPTDQRSIEIPQVTVILATDQPGKLLNALEKRMELTIQLGYYTPQEMKAIVERIASDFDLLLSPQAANQLASFSHGIPRKAKHLLQSLRRHFLDAENRQLGKADVDEFRESFQIDELGLGEVERDYLRFLRRIQRASLDSLAFHLGYDSDYIRSQIEPCLRRADLIFIGPGGRQLTEEGRNHIDQQLETPTNIESL